MNFRENSRAEQKSGDKQHRREKTLMKVAVNPVRWKQQRWNRADEINRSRNSGTD